MEIYVTFEPKKQQSIFLSYWNISCCSLRGWSLYSLECIWRDYNHTYANWLRSYTILTTTVSKNTRSVKYWTLTDTYITTLDNEIKQFYEMIYKYAALIVWW